MPVMGTATGLHQFFCPEQGKKGGEGVGVGGGVTTCTGRYKGVRAVRLELVGGGGWFEVLWNL